MLKTPENHGGAVEDRARLVEAVAGRRAGRLAAAALAKGLTLDDVVNHGRRERWPAGAVGRLEAAVALVRAADRDARPPAAFDQPAAIAAFVARRHLPLDVEYFGLLLLSCQNTLLEDHTISIGGTAGAIVDTKRIGRLIMRRATAAVISWHNHPSGDSRPSPEDHQIWQHIDGVARMLGAEPLDHVIVTHFGGDWYSRAVGTPQPPEAPNQTGAHRRAPGARYA